MLDNLVAVHPEVEPFVPELERRLSTPNAIHLINQLYHRHIKTDWLPRALAKIEPKIQDCLSQLATLGPAPTGDDVTVPGVTAQALARLDKAALLTELRAAGDAILADFPQVAPGWSQQVKSHRAPAWPPTAARAHCGCVHACPQEPNWESTEVYARVRDYLAEQGPALSAAGVGKVVDALRSATQAAFDDSQTDWKLERFATLRDRLVHAAAADVNTVGSRARHLEALWALAPQASVTDLLRCRRGHCLHRCAARAAGWRRTCVRPWQPTTRRARRRGCRRPRSPWRASSGSRCCSRPTASWPPCPRPRTWPTGHRRGSSCWPSGRTMRSGGRRWTSACMWMWRTTAPMSRLRSARRP
jgi:hypothetical protein